MELTAEHVTKILAKKMINCAHPVGAQERVE